MVDFSMLFARFNLLIMATTSLHAQTFGEHYENHYAWYYIDCQVQQYRMPMKGGKISEKDNLCMGTFYSSEKRNTYNQQHTLQSFLKIGRTTSSSTGTSAWFLIKEIHCNSKAS
ncbi:hypothetical protein V6N13_062836 [Hibiscus sabdariffa]|uniref:Secreted protein n=2 Tax=Hibiscus sabdariffa TaxID=183260 RepID=A0ABR2ARN0_9ROSI